MLRAFARLQTLVVVCGIALVVGCSEPRRQYERQVTDFEPIYCYQTLGGPNCYATPRFRDERQLINYFGKHPEDYSRPVPPEPAELQPPPEVDHYCRAAAPDPCALPEDSEHADEPATASVAPPAAPTPPPAELAAPSPPSPATTALPEGPVDL